MHMHVGATRVLIYAGLLMGHLEEHHGVKEIVDSYMFYLKSLSSIFDANLTVFENIFRKFSSVKIVEIFCDLVYVHTD